MKGPTNYILKDIYTLLVLKFEGINWIFDSKLRFMKKPTTHRKDVPGIRKPKRLIHYKKMVNLVPFP